MKRIKYILLALAIAPGLIGCATYTRDIKIDAMPAKIKESSVQRQCSVEVLPIVSNKEIDKDLQEYSGDKSNLRYIVPLLLLNFWSNSGPVFTGEKDINETYLSDLQYLMNDTIVRSKIVSGKGKQYKLKTELLHLYGSSYVKSSTFVGAGGSASDLFTFWPTGYASMKLSLIDADTKAVVSTRVISNAYMLNPTRKECMDSINNSAYGVNMTPHRMTVACISLAELMREVPSTVDQMLSGVGSLKVTSGNSPSTFVVARLTSEYDYLEEMTIEYATGRIISDKIVNRTCPIVSRNDEWIVLPEQNGHWMEQDEYDKLVKNLSSRYKVGFKDNLSAATFEGNR